MMKRILQHPVLWVLVVVVIFVLVHRMRRRAMRSMPAAQYTGNPSSAFLESYESQYEPQGGPTMTGFAGSASTAG
jgi:hypothetical protein